MTSADLQSSTLSAAYTYQAPPAPPAGMTAIRHIIFTFQENRSFDQYFGVGLGIGDFHDLLASAVGILRFEIYQPQNIGSDGVLFEDLTFDAGQPIPEPGTLLLLGSGILAFARRRRSAPSIVMQ